jgi:hypothetical protein
LAHTFTNPCLGCEPKVRVATAEQRAKVNWLVIVFNNLYNRLWGFSTLIKPNASKDNIKFKVTKVVNILVRNCLLIDPKFILLESDEEEGATKPVP